jgi:hypothetical protein
MRDAVVPFHPGAPRASGTSGMVADARHDAAARARRDLRAPAGPGDLGVLGDLAVRFSSWRFAAEPEYLVDMAAARCAATSRIKRLAR